MHFGNLASLLIVYHITKTEMVDRRHARFLNINLGLAIFLIDHFCGEKGVPTQGKAGYLSTLQRQLELAVIYKIDEHSEIEY